MPFPALTKIFIGFKACTSTKSAMALAYSARAWLKSVTLPLVAGAKLPDVAKSMIGGSSVAGSSGADPRPTIFMPL